MRKTVVLLGVGMALAVALAGCSSGADAGASGSTGGVAGASASKQTPTPNGWLPPTSDLPNGFKWITGPHYKIAVPQAWEELKSSDTQGPVPIVVYVSNPSSPAQGPRISFVNDPATNSANSSLVVVADQKAHGATNVSRVHVTWPGTQDAWLVDWSKPTPDGSVQRRRQLLVDLDQHVGITLLATLPSGDFDSSGLPQIMQTLQVAA